MTLINATKSCFLKYAQFSGRAPRSEFWNFILFLLLAHIALIIVNSMIFGPTVTQAVRITIDSSGQQTQGMSINTQYNSGVMGMIFTLATLLPWFAITWRRMHDTGLPGWYSLLPILVWLIGFGLLSVTSVPVPIDTSMIVEDIPMPGSMNVPRWPLLIPGVWFACVGSIILVVIWLACASDPEPNRFGAVPGTIDPERAS